MSTVTGPVTAEEVDVERTWAQAMHSSMHAATGFYARGRGPDRDFRTATTTAPDLLADAVVATAFSGLRTP